MVVMKKEKDKNENPHQDYWYGRCTQFSSFPINGNIEAFSAEHNLSKQHNYNEQNHLIKIIILWGWK
jgi:hypothetical protein